MRKKEIEFDIYLKKNSQESMVEKIDGKEEKDETVYRSGYSIKDTTLIFFIILNDSAFSSVMCRVGTLQNKEKRNEILELVNYLNFRYTAAKFTLDLENNLDFKIDFIGTDEEFNPEMVIQVTLNVLKMVEQDFENIMKVLNEQ